MSEWESKVVEMCEWEKFIVSTCYLFYGIENGGIHIHTVEAEKHIKTVDDDHIVLKNHLEILIEIFFTVRP